MRTIKNVFSQFHRFLLWAVISTVFWAWIFTLVTDTLPAKKVVLFAQVALCQDRELAVRLEEEKPEGIRMVKVHPFSYASFNEAEVTSADLFVVRSSEAEEMLPGFAPLDDQGWDWGDRELYRANGQVYGVKIYDAATGECCAGAYLTYYPGEDCYLFFNAESLHLADGDGAAFRVADTLLNLR